MIPLNKKSGRVKIAWIDDNIGHFKYNIANLALANYDLLCTSKVSTFLQFLQNQEINIAIVDLNLDGMNSGEDLIKSIKMDFPEIRIIVYSKMITKDKDFSYDSGGSMLLSIDPAEALKLDTSITKLDVAVSNILNTEVPAQGPEMKERRRPVWRTWSPKWQENSKNAKFCITRLLPIFAIFTFAIKFSAKSGSGLGWAKYILADKLLLCTLLCFLLVVLVNTVFCPKEIRKKSSREKFLADNMMLYENDSKFSKKIDDELVTANKNIRLLKPFNRLSDYYLIANSRNSTMRWTAFSLFWLGISLAILSFVSSLITAVLATT